MILIPCIVLSPFKVHVLCTLNGDNTMHGMRIIAALTNGKFQYDMIERKKVPNSEINSLKLISVFLQKKILFQV